MIDENANKKILKKDDLNEMSFCVEGEFEYLCRKLCYISVAKDFLYKLGSVHYWAHDVRLSMAINKFIRPLYRLVEDNLSNCDSPFMVHNTVEPHQPPSTAAGEVIHKPSNALHLICWMAWIFFKDKLKIDDGISVIDYILTRHVCPIELADLERKGWLYDDLLLKVAKDVRGRDRKAEIRERCGHLSVDKQLKIERRLARLEEMTDKRKTKVMEALSVERKEDCRPFTKPEEEYINELKHKVCDAHPKIWRELLSFCLQERMAVPFEGLLTFKNGGIEDVYEKWIDKAIKKCEADNKLHKEGKSKYLFDHRDRRLNNGES